jgi:two-component system, LuxR family, sensor kinase FixL
LIRTRAYSDFASNRTPRSAPPERERRSYQQQSHLSARVVWLAVFVAIAYYLGARLGLALTLKPQPISALWPPNAILLAVLLLARPRSWPLLLCATFVAHMAAELQGGVPLLMVLCWFVSNAFEALVGAALIRASIRGPFSFDRLHHVVAFILIGALFASFISSFPDAAFVKIVGWGQTEYWELWRTRFFSNVLGALTVAPAIVCWSTAPATSTSRLGLMRWVEAGVLSAGLAISLLLFSGQQLRVATTPAVLYAPLPFLLWAAVRFGVRGASTALLLATFAAIWEVMHGYGPFVAPSATDSALAIQLFLIVLSIPLLALAAVVHEQERTKANLRENQERLNLALNAAQMGTWDWLIGHEVNWSPETRCIFGLSEADCEITPQLFFERLHSDDREKVKQAMARAIREGTQFEIEFRVVRPDGQVRWVMAKGKTISAEAGQSARMLGINMDITERKAAEIEAEEHRRQLSHLTRVAMLGELSGALAHEINQPLTAILSNTQTAQRLLRRPSADVADMVEILADIEHDTRRASDVIKRLRVLLRKGEIQLQPLFLNDIVQEVLDFAHADLVTRNVAVDTYLEQGMPEVLGDRVQLQQVVLNLVMNACEAMSGTPALARRLRVYTAPDTNGMLRVSIGDCGVGIAQGQLEKVFEPFFTTKDHGLGLGLSISRSLITAHGGRLWAESNSQGGATFHFSLRRYTGEMTRRDAVS